MDSNDLAMDQLMRDALLKEIELSTARHELAHYTARKTEIRDAINREESASAKVVADLREQIRLEQARLEEALRAERERLADAETKRFDKRREAMRLEDEFNSLQRQIDQARRAAMQAGEWKALEARWDALTMGAPWREWAKDHQLIGAKSMTYHGRKILGDTMGLGKTLTALIACDMIQAATKDASEDNPVEFGSM